MSKRPMLNEALRLVRLYSQFSQADLAKRLDVSQSLISDIESGNKNPTLSLLQKYSDELGIKISQLLFFSEELDGQHIARRGQLIFAESVLKILETIKPREHVKR